MTFDEAMTAARAGRKMILQHWCWVYVSKNQRGGLSIYEEDGSPRGPFRPTRGERQSTSWMDYPESHAA